MIQTGTKNTLKQKERMTQMQLIRALGDAMAWFERELEWGVPPTELRHLCGRIGELYAAIITNGTMALNVNQMGFDVLGENNEERISVKTTAKMGSQGHISFNKNSLLYVDRVMIFRIDTDDMKIQTLLDKPIAEAIILMTDDGSGNRNIALSKLDKAPAIRSVMKSVRQVFFNGTTIRELENGSIEVERNGEVLIPAKPILREIAMVLDIELLNDAGNPHNTRHLGGKIISRLQ
jgi:hypothetical protein